MKETFAKTLKETKPKRETPMEAIFRRERELAGRKAEIRVKAMQRVERLKKQLAEAEAAVKALDATKGGA